MEVNPPKDRQIKDRIIFGFVKLLGHKLYFLFLLIGLLVLFAKFSINEENSIICIVVYFILAIVPRWIIKKKFRIYEYDPRQMSASEAQARADLGLPEPQSLKGITYGLRDVMAHFRRMKNDPQYAREYKQYAENKYNKEEVYREATIPFYKSTKKVNDAINAPVVWYAKGLIKLELFIWKKIKKLSKR